MQGFLPEALGRTSNASTTQKAQALMASMLVPTLMKMPCTKGILVRCLDGQSKERSYEVCWMRRYPGAAVQNGVPHIIEVAYATHDAVIQLGLVQSLAHRVIGCKPDRLTHLRTPSTEAQCSLHAPQPFQPYINGKCASIAPVASLATCEMDFNPLPQRQAVVNCDLPSSSSNFLGAFTARFARSEDILLRRQSCKLQSAAHASLTW